MDAETFHRAEALFHEWMALPPAERKARADQLAAAEPTVAHYVQELVSAAERDADFLEMPASLPGEAWGRGERIDDFEILALLGQGSFGTVYLARQISLGRVVALKASPDIGTEGRTMAPLEHEGIVRVFSEIRLPALGLRLLNMQFVPGLPLDELARELPAESRGPEERWGERLLATLEAALPEHLMDKKGLIRRLEFLEGYDPLDFVLWLGAKLAEALEYAHRRGVLHLDVKPANILMHLSGLPLLSDFNVSASALSPRVLGGTERFMAPEQRAAMENHAGPPVGPAADVFSLGVVLTELWKTWIPEDALGKDPELAISEGEARAILRDMTAPDLALRTPTAQSAADRLNACRKRREVFKQLPPMGAIRAWQWRRPALFLLALPVLPQFLGSFVSITYNELRIIDSLDAAQKFTFSQLVIGYNFLFYPTCIYLAYRYSRTLFRPWLEAAYQITHHRESLCREVTRTPLRILIPITLGWMPGAILFPLGLDRLSGPVPTAVYLHFFTSLTLSWLLGMTYAYLHLQMFCLRVLYPRFLEGVPSIPERAERDLKEIGPRLKVFNVLAVMVPLVGAIAILWGGPGDIGVAPRWVFPGLITVLVAAAGLGFFTVFSGLEEMSQTLFAYTSSAPAHRGLRTAPRSLKSRA